MNAEGLRRNFGWPLRNIADGRVEMNSMRAADLTAKDQGQVGNVPVPAAPEGWAFLKLADNGSCNTGLSILPGGHCPEVLVTPLSGKAEQ